MKLVLFGIIWLWSLYSYCQQIDQTVRVCETSPYETQVYWVGAGQYLYTWDVEEGVIISGSYTNEIEVDWSAVDTGVYKVYASIMNIYGCSDTSEIIIRVTGCPFSNMFLPNVFSPNDDQLNDIFIPIGYFDDLTEYKMGIYNRWGEEIFQSNNVMVGWDGTKNGYPAPMGSYIYLIEFRVYNKNNFRMGFVILYN